MTERNGVALVDPLSTAPAVAACHMWPISISPAGIANVPPGGAASEPGQPAFIGFDDTTSVRAQLGGIEINGRPFARVGSVALATFIAAQLDDVRKQPPSKRPAVLERMIAATFDEGHVRRTWTEPTTSTRGLVALSACSALLVFAVTPLVLFAVGPYPWWLVLLAAIVAVDFTIAVIYVRIHRTLFPDLSFDRWIQAVSMCLFPPAAMRCPDRLSRDALVAYHGMVVAPVLAGEAAVPFLRRTFFDLERADADDELDPEVLSCTTWFREQLRDQGAAALRRLKIDIQAAPEREDESMAYYCPRCHGQFTLAGEACAECDSIALVAFPSGRTPDGPQAVAAPSVSRQ